MRRVATYLNVVPPCKKQRRHLMMSFMILAACVATPAGSQEQTDAKDTAADDIVAAQVREQGYPCEEPTSAERDQGSDGAQGESWILRCTNASYRVELVPDMAARVQKID